MKKTIPIILLCSIAAAILSSCVTETIVTFNTDTQGADVYVDGEHIGKTPIMKKLSNAVWEDPYIFIRKEGYQDMHVRVYKEIKVINLLSGLFIWWPALLWVHGPKEQQYYLLSPIIEDYSK